MSEAKLKELLRFHYPVCTDTEKEILSMFRELEAERDHYRSHSQHAEDCDVNICCCKEHCPEVQCTCGLDAAKAKP